MSEDNDVLNFASQVHVANADIFSKYCEGLLQPYYSTQGF